MKLALLGHGAAIDFTGAEAVPRHAEACALARVPLVEGTTGWHAQLEDVRRTVERESGALIYGANFSVGVNLFYRVVARAAELFHMFDYAAFVEEAHHSRKRDAPSGTALRLRDILAGHDAAIDFTIADAVPRHAEACALARVPLVEGTTGWHARLDDVSRVFEREGGALIHGANFSVGVNLFYRVVARAAELFAAATGYEAFIEEAHHSRKRDAPSGTALRLRDIVADAFGAEPPVASTRAGHIPGTHRVGFDSAADTVTLTHAARSREGFAAGAVLAARWIQGRRGVYEFAEMFDEILKG